MRTFAMSSRVYLHKRVQKVHAEVGDKSFVRGESLAENGWEGKDEHIKGVYLRTV